jgi:cell division initiation protein
MKVTPLDLKQQRFKNVLRGFDRDEVMTFLEDAAESFEDAIREQERLKQEVSRLESILAEHRSQERNLRNALLTAQKLADDIRENAQQEGVRIVREAEGRADLILQKAQARLEDVQREIDGLRMKRREVETSLEALMSTLNNTLEFVREQDARYRDDKILLHRPKAVPEPTPVVAASASAPTARPGDVAAAAPTNE